jgi:hypothetical protein
MSVQCEFCLESFKNKTLLKQHQARAVYCKKYRRTIFSCDCCGFTTKGIKMIERHDQECPGIRTETNTVETQPDTVKPDTNTVETQPDTVKPDTNTVETQTDTVKPDTTEIDILKRNMELEKLKNKI